MVVVVYVVEVYDCALSRALRVIGPTLPSMTNPCDCWNALMACIDLVPSTPSTVRLGDGFMVVFSTSWMFILSCLVSILEGKEKEAEERRGNNTNEKISNKNMLQKFLFLNKFIIILYSKHYKLNI